MSIRASIRAVVALLLPVQLLAQQPQPPVLRSGDAVRIAVWRNAELSGEFRVLANGALSHPLYREVRVAGIPLAAMEDSLRGFLRQFEANPAFVVEPLFRVVVAGEVRSPNVYMLPPTTTIVEAVAAAGGGTELARMREVRFHRDGSTATIDLLEPDPRGMAAGYVQSGDQIYVERRQNVWAWLGPVTTLVGAVAAIVTLISTRN